ncbi:unnamed protein product [Phytophthora fragariaefolia]|uniref:Unnamed protein product n=1 Tax=Phytophthora fragariaefolia TaxID=1490495 RepID=A0A9W6UEP7_9STRA|nr:unnamed protein product [Phytophthora fragariaefolia]
MKEFLIGPAVGTVTGAVESTTNALTGTTTRSSSSGEVKSSTAPSTSTPASTKSASSNTRTSAPASTASTTPVPASTTETSFSATSSASSATSPPMTTKAAPVIYSSGSNASSLSAATPAEATISPSLFTTSPAALESSTTRSTSTFASSGSWSNFAQLRGGKEQGHRSVSFASFTGSSNEGNNEAGVTDIAGMDLSTANAIGLALGALGAFLLLVVFGSWCFRRSQQQAMSSSSHLRLGATGNIPVFNTRGTERFETSSTSVGFGPFHTTRLNGDDDSTSDGTGLSGLWDDDMITDMRIPLEKVSTTKLLSTGGYGEVYRGVYHDQTIAIKCLLPSNRKDLDQINAFLSEIKMMAMVDHPCIVRFIGVAWDSFSDLLAVMEFMEGGDLRSLLDRFKLERRPRGFGLDKARIALQTAQALTYLHSLDPKVLHRDLKSRNILLTSSLNAKLSDFGVARAYNFTSMTAAVGTSLWMAPEVMLGNRYDSSADIFSLGIVLSELDSHLQPYAEARMTSSGQRVPDAALLQLVVMGRISINFSPNAPVELVELGRACVGLNPLARPSASEVHYRLQLILQAYEMYTL